MAFPSIAATATTSRPVAETSSPVNLPAGIAAGNLLLVFFRSAGPGTIGWPAGWTEIAEDASDGSFDVTAIAWRKADGAEGATISVSHGSAKACALAWRITGAEDPLVQPPILSGVAVGFNGNPDSLLLAPTSGARDYLWLSMAGVAGISSVLFFPIDYPLAQLQEGSGSADTPDTNCRCYAAARLLNAASENPGPFVIDTFLQWTAWTVAVHPAGTPRSLSALFETAGRVAADFAIGPRLSTFYEVLPFVYVEREASPRLYFLLEVGPRVLGGFST